jgi:hypothetical protein
VKKDLASALATPWYYGCCCLNRIPLKPIKRTNTGRILFEILFWYILITQIVVIQPVLNVYYFMMSTLLISIKLYIVFYMCIYKDPGYVERDYRNQFEFKELLKTVPSNKLCPYTKVIRPPRSKYCHISDKVIDRYETYCFWINNGVGRANFNHYVVFIFYVWLDVFLLGWISMSSIGVTECQPEKYDTPCYYRALCLGCNNLVVHYIDLWRHDYLLLLHGSHLLAQHQSLHQLL